MVDFPSSDSHLSTSISADVRYQRPPHLPFRRISLPSAPNLLQRQSVVSTVSFDSLPEEAHTPVVPVVIKNAVRGPKHRPSSLDGAARKGGRRKDARVQDEQREVKRRKVIGEFYETEKSYVDGLELIYAHFLTPIIASLDTPHPLLDRSELTSVFSNFIDIWNLHRSFYSSLTAFLNTSASNLSQDAPSRYLRSFSDALSSYAHLLRTNHAFASFIAQQEADPRCGKLKFRDWLLTIVQRCPRYLLLLKDMIGCTDREDPEYASLIAVHTLVSKITLSLNTSLHTHAQTLALLALQRNTANLPFQLITPGRTFLKRAPLLQLEGSIPKEREFLLFSDCLIWLASADGDCFSDKWELQSGARRGGRPSLVRTRSKSDADLPFAAEAVKRRESLLKFHISGSPKKKTRHASSGVEDRWIYKGYMELVDLEVVVSSQAEPGEEGRFELLSPERSFAVFAANEEERDEWSSAIRNAKASLLISLNAMQPNSTLTSSSSTNHLRRTLQALPYSPAEDSAKPKRVKVEHFMPAIWIPDGKTESCMRCVCSGCSGKTFFIFDPNSKDAHKAARACDACYETVFPLLNVPPSVSVSAGTTHSHFTLSGLKSMPSLLMRDTNNSTPSVLMALDRGSPRRAGTRIDDDSPAVQSEDLGSPAPAIRVKPPPRPRSYIQILEDFQEHEHMEEPESPGASRYSGHAGGDAQSVLDERDEEPIDDSQYMTAEPPSPGDSLPATPKKENTARVHKRFSLPAVALQTTPVTARPNAVGEGKSRRFSLILGKSASSAHSGEGSRLATGSQRLKHSAAAGKLSDLLGRSRER
ncbi:Rac guanine nucleotide exchange factor B [Grifola frondosa]|uniref:Rac guanine nucleotide exchange factor B n=1 Tax=Grifola frondosa TaxID=5627 RepID=A0A1C7LUW2_GRIFR|nr:Rac guanine nucleotide exchange factor B [Grifola frondosa]